jgi:hypothetical protein
MERLCMMVAVSSRAFGGFEAKPDGRKAAVVGNEQSKVKSKLGIGPFKIVVEGQHRDDECAFVDRFQEQVPVHLLRIEFKLLWKQAFQFGFGKWSEHIMNLCMKGRCWSLLAPLPPAVAALQPDQNLANEGVFRIHSTTFRLKSKNAPLACS